MEIKIMNGNKKLNWIQVHRNLHPIIYSNKPQSKLYTNWQCSFQIMQHCNKTNLLHKPVISFLVTELSLSSYFSVGFALKLSQDVLMYRVCLTEINIGFVRLEPNLIYVVYSWMITFYLHYALQICFYKLLLN